MNKYQQNKQEINKLFNAPQFKKLKYAALIVIGLIIATQLAMIAFIDTIPYKMMMFLRGCIGLGAIIFVTLCAILAYKVYSKYFSNK